MRANARLTALESASKEFELDVADDLKAHLAVAAYVQARPAPLTATDSGSRNRCSKLTPSTDPLN
jgi:hypothetical protein